MFDSKIQVKSRMRESILGLEVRFRWKLVLSLSKVDTTTIIITYDKVVRTTRIERGKQMQQGRNNIKYK
jgi:hypothetical protein